MGDLIYISHQCGVADCKQKARLCLKKTDAPGLVWMCKEHGLDFIAENAVILKKEGAFEGGNLKRFLAVMGGKNAPNL